MEVSSGSEEGFVREWAPCSNVLNLIPPRIQTGLFSSELCLTCVDAVSEYIALGTNVGLVYWYDRKKGNIQRLRCEASNSPITFVKIVSTVDYMVGAGNATGQVTVFQIPKEHPDNIPDNFKPKVEPKVERYTIGELHKSQITAIEWSKNGMRLFSGDKNGVIIMTEIDFYMHLCKSMEIVNEGHEIVQMSYHQSTLLVSSLYRSILCERRDGKWLVSQIGKRERKSLCALGATFQHSYAADGGGAASVYCARPGLRLWRADVAGQVLQTLLFKEAISNPLTVAEVLNPAATRHCHSARDYQLGPLHVFLEKLLVSHNEHFLYILEPRSLQALAVLDQLRRVLSVSVNKDEIFVLEGPRSLIRLAHAPEPAALAPDDEDVMSKSLSTLQSAASALRDHTAPYIARALQPIAIFTQQDLLEQAVTDAEECFELPPIKQLPSSLPGEVLVSIVNEFKDTTTDVSEKSEEIKRKLQLYNSIMEKKYDEELIHSRSRSRRREGGSGGSTPRVATPVRREGVVTAPCVMNVSVFDNLSQQSDDLLEKQIEEKEKILAKMLNLDSLSIPTNDDTLTHAHDTPTHAHHSPMHTYNHVEIQEKADSPEKDHTQEKFNAGKRSSKEEKTNKQENKMITSIIKEPNPIDLIPKVVKLPNTWNLDNMELKLDLKVNGYKDNRVISPDENLESEWEFV